MPAGDSSGYSRAFDNFVQSDDDVVGLLAYGLFKRGVREEAQRGRPSIGRDRDPPPTVVDAYRHAAEGRLSSLVEAALEAARPELQSSALLDAMSKSTAELKEHVTARTDFKSSFLVNIVAWIVTLALTAMIIWLMGKPDPASMLTRTRAGPQALKQPIEQPARP